MTLKEEIGRNYHTSNNDPYSWKDSPDLDISQYVTNDGKYAAQIKCHSRPELSTPLRVFEDEESASHWSRQQGDRIVRMTINELRTVVRDVLLEYRLEHEESEELYNQGEITQWELEKAEEREKKYRNRVSYTKPREHVGKWKPRAKKKKKYPRRNQ